MVDILIRNVDDAVAAQLKKKAKAAGKSMNDFAREAPRAAALACAEADRIRAKISSESRSRSTRLYRRHP